MNPHVPEDRAGRTYPLPRTETDPRFTFGLLLDVKDVLEKHGYPPIRDGRDLTELRQALFRFLYAKEETTDV